MIIYFPDIKVSKQQRVVRDDAEIWYEHGFTWETSVVAATIYNTINKLERKIKRLEGKKIRNSRSKKTRKTRNNVVLLRNQVSKEN